MVQVRQRVLIAAAALLLPAAAGARRFYDDDPMWREPRPLHVDKAARRKLSEYYDYFLNQFGKPGEKATTRVSIPAGAVNTLGEVPDSAWYTNRHRPGRMSIAELARGPGNENAPAAGKWRIVEAKGQGITPGFQIVDAKNRRYLIKFDPAAHPEIASAADAVGAKFFYALGYNTPENYIVHFTRDQLTIDPKAEIIDRKGRKRRFREQDIDDILAKAPPPAAGRYRALASFFIKGKPLDGFRYHGTRSDDPNDVVPHERRRDLRGLYVFASWLQHTDTKSINTHDTHVTEGGASFIKHYLIDFGAILGSDSFEPKSPRAGHVPLFSWGQLAVNIPAFGLYVPRWMRADYPHIRGVGRLESATFEPDKWTGNYYNPAFANRLPDDAFWAARQVMAFTNEEILAIVQTGEYTDPEAAAYIAKILADRRDKIGRTWFSKVLPLDGFRVSGRRLEFDDLGVKYNFEQPRGYTVSWFRFDNETEAKTPIPGASSLALPEAAGRAGYYGADIHAGDPARTITVYVRSRGGAPEVVGIDRRWAGIERAEAFARLSRR
ncbi:MAG: hypothetical protein HYZ57_05045 [Acidobacteria bacterium]|nr:hypothetical protein [Acidobacteriota bacterium]